MHGGYSEIYGDCTLMFLLETSTIDVQIVREEHNLPVVFDSGIKNEGLRFLESKEGSGTGF